MGLGLHKLMATLLLAGVIPGEGLGLSRLQILWFRKEEEIIANSEL